MTSARLKNILYIVIPIVLTVWILGHEFIWRFTSPLDLKQEIRIRSHSGILKTLVIRQYSTTAVDTARRSFRDVKHGITDCRIWLAGSQDTLHTNAVGRYFSDFRVLHLCTDSSEQVMMIPNSEQGMSIGWGELIYLTPDDSIRTTQISNGNIGDVNKDGSDDILDERTGRWSKLDPQSGQWVPIVIQ